MDEFQLMATKVLSLDYLYRVIQVFAVLYIVRSTNAIVQTVRAAVPRNGVPRLLWSS